MVEHRSLDVGGVLLAYQASGPLDAPPLVLLHALGEDATGWDAVAPVFTRSRRVYALDLRGHGRSDWPGNYSFELMRADVLRFLDAPGCRMPRSPSRTGRIAPGSPRPSERSARCSPTAAWPSRTGPVCGCGRRLTTSPTPTPRT
ncbi:alpha/beta fold hydrolase [Streptomyces sp. NPDC048415]|uniref:alpha/beta fold hydrolase n=1 Tax=Streptomyces sp. NPDC048415 TaxID=3154822 RepID=UPI003428BAA0